MSIPTRERAGVTPPRVSANDRFKARYRTVFWCSMLAAAILHGIFLRLSPVVGHVRPWLSTLEWMALSPPLDKTPSPPPPPVSPAVPPVPGLTGTPGWEEIPKPPQPLFEPPPHLPASELLRDLMDGPTFTPYSVAPVLKNPEAVVDALGRSYHAGTPGIPDHARAEVWFLIDEFGAIARTLIKASTGHAELDEAVLEAAALMEFTPAWSSGRTVPVWISLPVVFRIASEEAGTADTTGRANSPARPDSVGERFG